MTGVLLPTRQQGGCGFSSDIFSLGIVMWELASQVGPDHTCSAWCSPLPDKLDWYGPEWTALPQLQPLCSSKAFVCHSSA